MKKIIILGAAIISAFAAVAPSAAEGGKHLINTHDHGSYRPAYVAPAPRYGHGYGHGYGNGYRGGYWNSGRWIAPVAIAAAIGGLAIAGNSYYYSQPSYVAPSYYAPTTTYYDQPTYAAPSYYAPARVTYAAPAADGFNYADANGDGYISFEEAAVYPHWQRNFGRIDRNRDGYLTRDEVAGWRYR
ncbi:MAG: hypothetical protein ABIZ64_05320 [Casimicrobium sp.]